MLPLDGLEFEGKFLYLQWVADQNTAPCLEEIACYRPLVSTSLDLESWAWPWCLCWDSAHFRGRRTASRVPIRSPPPQPRPNRRSRIPPRQSPLTASCLTCFTVRLR